MVEFPPELNNAPDTAPAFFCLGAVSNSRVKGVLHHIQKRGMEDPQSTRSLLSLFQPEDFTDDTFHVLSPSIKPQTLWDQVARTASNPWKLTIDQKGALTSLKYFALRSLAEGQRGLDESVRVAATTELREYDAYLAKALDPEDFVGVHFFDKANVAGRVVGRAAKIGGTLYLMSSLIGCSFGGISPTHIEQSAATANPAVMQTVPAMTETQAPTPTATTEPTPTETLVPTEIPMPAVPESVITSSLGLINVTPVKDETTGAWVINDQLGRAFWRWDNRTQTWLDERPLYWQCGRALYTTSVPTEPPGTPLYSSSAVEEVRAFPTGLRSDGEFYDEVNNLNLATVRACVTEINVVPDPYSSDTVVFGKVVFFDADGKVHEYNIGGGTMLSNGNRDKMPFIVNWNQHDAARTLDIALGWLDEYYNNPKPIASRQLDLDIVTQDPGALWKSYETVNRNRDITLQLIDALKTGKGFPENVPDDYFVWVSQISFMPDYKPSTWRTPQSP